MINYFNNRLIQTAIAIFVFTLVVLGSFLTTAKAQAATTGEVATETFPLLVNGAKLALAAVEERSKLGTSAKEVVASEQKIVELIARLKELMTLYQSMLAEKRGVDYVKPVDLSKEDSVDTVKDGQNEAIRPEFFLGVLSPNGGEIYNTIAVDELIRVKYDTNLPIGAKLRVSLNSTEARALITNTAEVTQNGEAFLDLADANGLVTGNIYKVSVCAPDYRTSPIDARMLCDSSDSYFKIITETNTNIRESLKVVYPNGGETLFQGETYVLKWSSTNVGADETIALYLMDIEGNLQAEPFAKVRNRGYHEITFKDLNTFAVGKYKLYIATPPEAVGVNRQITSDTSDAYFKIASPVDGSIDPIIKPVQ